MGSDRDISMINSVRRSLSGFVILSLFICVGAQASFSQTVTTTPQGVIVKVRPGYLATGQQRKAAAQNPADVVGEWSRAAGVARVRPLWSPATPSGPSLSAGVSGHPASRTFMMATEAGETAADVVARLEQLPWVEYAEIDRLLELHQSPNDPLYDRQWHLENTGQPYFAVERIPGLNNDTLAERTGSPGADVRFESVYNHPGPKSSILVCIIDTGLDTDHEDIIERLFLNAGEIPDNGIDDDRNGFTDDVYGYDFSGDVRIETPLDVMPDSSVTDTIGHGTHVAGTVAATVDNGIGIAGVSDSARVFACKIFPYAYFSVSARAIYYAVMRGARVINMSWGGQFPSKTLEDALRFAHERGVVLVTSMGNSGGDHVFYPSSYSMTIGVGASTALDQLATFSTYNDHVDIVAPGQAVLSLRADTTDLYATGDEPDVHIIDDHYYIAS
ncbi:MAG: S8 family serine peptidase, partial [candidate division Zixibacteria bacterium]|nr:S8 family serine peptidase [candidate division Zixibacteria bacterium]